MNQEHITALQNISNNFQENLSLKEKVLIRIGGPARLYLESSDENEIEDVLKYCLQNKVPLFILGNGSNTIFTEEGYNGVVLKPILKEISKESDATLKVGAGALWMQAIGYTHNIGLTGLENLGGIPGSIGGSIFGNAGAYGTETADVLLSINVLEINTQQKTVTKKSLSPEELHFTYRNSDIKKQHNMLVLSATIQVKPDEKQEGKQKLIEMLKKRNTTQPLDLPNAGCVFMNPDGQSAGKLIDQAGLKGKQFGGLKISDMHGNFVQNTGSGTFNDYQNLVTSVQKEIKKQFNIELVPEHIIVKSPK